MNRDPNLSVSVFPAYYVDLTRFEGDTHHIIIEVPYYHKKKERKKDPTFIELLARLGKLALITVLYVHACSQPHQFFLGAWARCLPLGK